MVNYEPRCKLPAKGHKLTEVSLSTERWHATSFEKVRPKDVGVTPP